MPRHHYVPQFLLRRWGGGGVGGKFVSYHFEEGAGRLIENSKANIASACQIKNLNTFFGVQPSNRDFPETRFFTPPSTPQPLLPETLRKMGPEETVKALNLAEAASKGPPEDEKTVTKIIQANLAVFKRNFPLDAAMELSADPAKLAAMEGMTWWIRRWPRDCILIADRPLLASPRAPYPCGIPLDTCS